MVSNRKEEYWQKSLEISQLAVTTKSLQHFLQNVINYYMEMIYRMNIEK